MEKKKVFIIGDTPTVPTGFSTVIKNIFSNLTDDFEISQLGINYYGDPHTTGWDIYPAYSGGDVWGFGRLISLLRTTKPDVIFILNDIWVIAKYLDAIKKEVDLKKIPIVAYFPVDSYNFDEEWFKDFDLVSEIVVYTKFGYDVVKAVLPSYRDATIIPHGVNTKDFYPVDYSKEELKRFMFPKNDSFWGDSFIVLNANRNQPRKRIDTTMEGFKLFAEDKPENVKLYLHMGLKDSGWNIIRLSKYLGIDTRLAVSNNNMQTQQVSVETLNRIYNVSDVGVNTSIGEGWGLVNVEHAVVGAPQIVPNHSACAELFSECGLLLPISNRQWNQETLTVSSLVRPEDLAYSLEDLYTNEELYNSLSKKAQNKFTQEEYNWKNISLKFKEVIDKCFQ